MVQVVRELRACPSRKENPGAKTITSQAGSANLVQLTFRGDSGQNFLQAKLLVWTIEYSKQLARSSVLLDQFKHHDSTDCRKIK